MTQTLSPEDTGEFHVVGEQTQRLDPFISTGPFPIVIRKQIDETAVLTAPDSIAVVDFMPKPGPRPDPKPASPKPNPAPPPRIDQAAAQPVAPLERVLTTGELPIIIDVADRQHHAAPERARWGFHHGRHRRPTMLSRLFGGAR